MTFMSPLERFIISEAMQLLSSIDWSQFVDEREAEIKDEHKNLSRFHFTHWNLFYC